MGYKTRSNYALTRKISQEEFDRIFSNNSNKETVKNIEKTECDNDITENKKETYTWCEIMTK